MMRQFCRESLYLYEDAVFDFDTTSITNDNLDACIDENGYRLPLYYRLGYMIKYISDILSFAS